jgi:hypothetical protein
MDDQRIRGQSALISRAASQGMTPMELLASGQVTVHMPDDALAFDKSRQLPAPDEQPAISEEESPQPWSTGITFISTPIMRNGHFKDDCQLCGGPCHQTELWELASKKLGEQMERMLAVDPAKDPEDTVIIMRDTSAPTIYPGSSERATDIRSRMEEWLARDGGRSFAEGFNGYFDAGRGAHTPRAPEEAAVPPTSEPINDDEVVEGEIVPDPLQTLKGSVLRPEAFFAAKQGVDAILADANEIIDAEVVEDD